MRALLRAPRRRWLLLGLSVTLLVACGGPFDLNPGQDIPSQNPQPGLPDSKAANTKASVTERSTATARDADGGSSGSDDGD
ncbi:MAG: hypothetical protein QM756_03695 [Polyangiaceae bacterium]